MASTCLSHRHRIHTDYQFLISDFSSIFWTYVTSDLKEYLLCSENLRDRTQSLTVNMFVITHFMFSYPCIYRLSWTTLCFFTHIFFCLNRPSLRSCNCLGDSVDM